MSTNLLPLQSHNEICATGDYNDSRWAARPQYNRQGNVSDLDWILHPLQPPYLGTFTPDMSYDTKMYVNKQGQFKPEVTSDPCSYPVAPKYTSFGKSVWEYDHTYPSLTLPKGKTCQYFAKDTLPDIACLDQQQLMKRDTYNKHLWNRKMF